MCDTFHKRFTLISYLLVAIIKVCRWKELNRQHRTAVIEAVLSKLLAMPQRQELQGIGCDLPRCEVGQVMYAEIVTLHRALEPRVRLQLLVAILGCHKLRNP